MGKTKQEVGATRISQNNYHYTKMEDGTWRLTHHIIAEKEILMRPLMAHERVKFIDASPQKRIEPTADNIQIVTKGTATKAKVRARLVSRIDELQAQLKALDAS